MKNWKLYKKNKKRKRSFKNVESQYLKKDKEKLKIRLVSK